MRVSTYYRLCVFRLRASASGSLIIDIFSFSTFTIVSCLHFGQNSGKCISTVSARIRVRVLLLQTGHNSHPSLSTSPPAFNELNIYFIFSHSFGILTMKQLPSPDLLSTITNPPCAITMDFAIVSPIPAPPDLRFREFSVR